jgi:hypothetical protein
MIIAIFALSINKFAKITWIEQIKKTLLLLRKLWGCFLERGLRKLR